MKWTPQQAAALSAVDKWFRDPKGSQVYKVFGWAGTGKTTMARHFAEGVNGRVLAAAYTGKAAHILTTKGLPATTIHSLAYVPKVRGTSGLRELEERLLNCRLDLAKELDVDGGNPAIEAHPRYRSLQKELRAAEEGHRRPLFDLNPDSELKGAALLILDECSMVGNQIGEDLDSFGCRTLVLGDPFQLPPVGDGGYYTNGEPDMMLTDIQRQARDNPIIQLSMTIREEQRLPAPGRYGESSVKTRSDISATEALAAGQLLVGRNATRLATNVRVRKLLGRAGWMPETGDRVVCLRNDREAGLLNGSLWEVQDATQQETEHLGLSIRSLDLGDRSQVVTAHPHYFQGVGKDIPYWDRKSAQEFDYGYALTVHKAQGSQWDDVMLFDESGAFREHRWRWLYTGVTRAAEKLTMVTGSK